MRLIRHGIATIAAALFATPALAVDTSFYTYGGFPKTVTAFQTAALVLSDPRFEHLVFIFAVVGIAIGAVSSMARSGGSNLIPFAFQTLVGAGLFAGLVATTGTVNVYDPVRNDYEAVGGVPNLVVILAGTTNLIERAVIEIVDSASPTVDRQVQYGGAGNLFRLLYNSVSPKAPLVDTYLDMTVKDYVRQCVPVAVASDSYDVSYDELLRTSSDLQASLGKAGGPSTYSTVYSSTNKAGVAQTCADAWTYIDTELKSANTFTRFADGVCSSDDFNIGRPVEAVRCRQELSELGATFFGHALTQQQYFANVFLGRTIGDVLLEDSPSVASRVMANRAIVTTGLSTMSQMDELLPTLKAVVFAIMLLLISISLLFIMTPLMHRVAMFGMGLFVFLAMWGVVDAAIFRMSFDQAYLALGEMASNNVGANAWITAPESAMKTLAIFGTYRTASAGIAAMFVFTVFRFSGEAFNAITGTNSSIVQTGTAAAAPIGTSEGLASALSAQSAAQGTFARAGRSSSFGDFAENSNFGANRDFGAASSLRELFPSRSGAGGTASDLGGIDAGRTAGGIDAVAKGRDLSNPQVLGDARRNAASAAVQEFARNDEFRDLAHTYMGPGQAGERAFARAAEGITQMRAFGDRDAYGKALSDTSRYFEGKGYSPDEAQRKAAAVMSDASLAPVMGKVVANAYDGNAMLRNATTGAEVERGAMEGRRDAFGGHVTSSERAATGTEQLQRSGSATAAREAAGMLGIGVDEMSRRASLLNNLSGEAKSTAMQQLAKSTGRSLPQAVAALEKFNAAQSMGVADGTTAQLASQGESVYGFSSQTSKLDTAERSGKRDAQAEIGAAGVRSSSRIGEERRQGENFGFAGGAAAMGTSVRGAANLQSFVGAVQSVAGGQVEMADGGAGGVADRARNAATTGIVQNERLSRMQGLLKGFGVDLGRKDLAMTQNGDFSMNLNPAAAEKLADAGLISQEQYGAIAGGGSARFSFDQKDMLVSSSTGFDRSATSNTSSRIEAGKQAGSDSVAAMLTGGRAGQQRFANFVRGGIELGSNGQTHINPQLADTLVRDLQGTAATTGWDRTINRAAADEVSGGTSADFRLGNSGASGGARTGTGGSRRAGGNPVQFGAGYSTNETGRQAETASAQLNVISHDIRGAINESARASGGSAERFTQELSKRVFGDDGIRNRYLRQADSARGTFDPESPMTSAEQHSLLRSGRFTTDRAHGIGDGPQGPSGD